MTTDGTAGCAGITVSAVSSVSADPPLILVCVNRRSPAANAIRDNGVFAVSLLSTSQVLVFETFAGRASNGPAFDFDCAEWHVGPTGCRLLSGAVSSFDCVVQIAQDAGSHTVFIGRVVHVTAAAQEPLAHSRRRYCTTTRLSNNPAARTALDRSERVTGR